MPVWKQQNSFTGGEISPRLEGRTDLKQYGNSVAELENFFPHSYGGIAKAPGLYFVCEIKDSSVGARLLPFERKVGQTYVLEVGDYYMRFIRDGALIRITPLAEYSAATTYDLGDVVTDAADGINYYSKTDSNTGNTPASSPDSWHAMQDDIYEIPTPWSYEESKDLGYCQSVDVMWITHEDHPPVRLGRYAETDWRIAEEVFIDGPFGTLNPTATTMYPSAATGNVSITVNGSAGINNGAGFLATDIGRHIRILNIESDPDEWGWGIITAVTNPALISVSVEGGSFPVINPTDIWKLGAFSDSTAYPREVMFFEQRIVYGGTAFEPQGVWLSQTDAYNVFTVSSPIVDSDACQFVLVADQTNDIAWMMASRELAIGTLGGEWTLSGAEGKVISPTSVNAKRYTTNGGSNIRPVHVGGSVLFVDRSRRSLLEMAYVFEDDGYSAPDLLLLSDQISREAQIVETSWQQSPDSKLYCVMSDGGLAVLTYKRDQEVIGWARRTTQGLFEATTSVSSQYRDVPYFVINRTINGVTKRFVEWMKSDFGDAVEPVPVIPGGSLPVSRDELFGVGGGNTGTFGSGSYLWEIDSALDGTEVTEGYPGPPHPLPDFNYRKQFGTRIFNSGTRSYRLGLGLIGKIGGKLYFNNHEYDSAQPNWEIQQYDAISGQSKTWGFTGLEAYVTGNSRHNDYHFEQAAIGWDKATDTKTLYFILCKKNGQNDETGSHLLMEGIFNDSTGKIDVDDSEFYDLNSGFGMDDAFPSTGYCGMAKMGVNSTHIFIPYRNENNLGNNQSGVWVVERDGLKTSGHLTSLQTWMKNPIAIEPYSPEIACCATDGYLFIIHDATRYTPAETVDSQLYIDIYQLSPKDDGTVDMYRMTQRKFDILDGRTDGLAIPEQVLVYEEWGADPIYCTAFDGMAIDGDYIYLSWFAGDGSNSPFGSWITKFKVTPGSAPWDIEHVNTFRNGHSPAADRCETYSIVIDEQDAYY